MTLKELWDFIFEEMNFLTFILIIAFILLIVGAITVHVANKNNIYGDGEGGEIRRVKAKVVSKRTITSAVNGIMYYWVVFEFENHERIELAIKEQLVFGVMVEGDEGWLKYQGTKRFISFEREF